MTHPRASPTCTHNVHVHKLLCFSCFSGVCQFNLQRPGTEPKRVKENDVGHLPRSGLAGGLARTRVHTSDPPLTHILFSVFWSI